MQEHEHGGENEGREKYLRERNNDTEKDGFQGFRNRGEESGKR